MHCLDESGKGLLQHSNTNNTTPDGHRSAHFMNKGYNGKGGNDRWTQARLKELRDKDIQFDTTKTLMQQELNECTRSHTVQNGAVGNGMFLNEETHQRISTLSR